MTDPASEGSGRRSALLYILGSTAVAGGIGYVIQAGVPVFLDAPSYVVFSVFWSIVYLVVSGISGLQQETTRATRLHPGGNGWSTIRRVSLIFAAVAAVLILATSAAWAPQTFGDDAPTLTAALIAAAIGYTFVASISGALYGLENWCGVALMTIIDAVLRLITVGAAILLVSGVAPTGWAVALPFAATALLVWILVGRRAVRHSVSLDVGLPTLLRHSAQTVGAAMSTGIMVSGLPFLLGVSPSGLDARLLASLILVITLTRAPLVVPLLALQSYLVVSFRDDASSLPRRVSVWGGGLAAVTAVLAGLAVFVGPWVVEFLYGGRYELPSPTYAAIVASAGLTGLLCITGPAVLSARRHGLYLAGWVCASAVTIICLFVPGDGVTKVVTALIAGPLAGIVVHSIGVFAYRRSLSA